MSQCCHAHLRYLEIRHVILSAAKDLASLPPRSFAALRACPERSEGMTCIISKCLVLFRDGKLSKLHCGPVCDVFLDLVGDLIFYLLEFFWMSLTPLLLEGDDDGLDDSRNR